MSIKKYYTWRNTASNNRSNEDYYDLFAVGALFTPEELERNKDLAAAALDSNRDSLKKLGKKVEALNGKPRVKKSSVNRRQNLEFDDLFNKNSQADADNGLNLAAHPELPYLGGDSDNIHFPAKIIEVEDISEDLLTPSQKEERSKQRRKKAELLDKLKNQYKLKNRYKIAAPAQRPKYAEKPRSRPLPRPPSPI